jgi:hypothetical protein
MDKRCPKCGEVKIAESDFHRSKSTKDGRACWCKVCSASNSRGWYERNKERAAERNRKWRESNPELVRAQWQRMEAKPATRARKQAYMQKLRSDALGAYSEGAPACACCGETAYEFCLSTTLTAVAASTENKPGTCICGCVTMNTQKGFRCCATTATFLKGTTGIAP